MSLIYFSICSRLSFAASTLDTIFTNVYTTASIALLAKTMAIPPMAADRIATSSPGIHGKFVATNFSRITQKVVIPATAKAFRTTATRSEKFFIFPVT